MKTKEFAEETNVSVKEKNAYKSTEDALVSVIIPTYNSSETISQCLKSVKSQTYRNIEIIVCDNFSDDSTVEIARSYRAKVFLRGKERAAQKNFGAKQASGDILYFIDSDFVLERDTVRRCVQALQNSHAVVTVNRSSGKGLWARSMAYKRDLLAHEESVIAARFIRTKVFFEVGEFDEELIIGEDIDLHRRLIEEGYGIKQVDAVEWHIGEPESLRELVLKNYYYAGNLRHYLKKNKRAIVNHLNPFKISLMNGIIEQPSLLFFSLAIVQIVIYITSVLGMLVSKMNTDSYS
ncbi:MAG: glycosyltransferase [Candidatus Bathyarchaeota archaeon]|nr:glycosyltransferase [Candidatus Bathyarchaeota archaeon]MDH5779671.1 glycosyltransferase [Candidatus Bathyarchaeota archaeon]